MKRQLAAFSLLYLAAAPAIASDNPRVKIDTNMGDIVVELYPAKAPKTVDNFLQYVKEGFYNDTVFHRVIGNFMIQGGGFNKNLEQKKTRAPIINEANNGLLNTRGTIAMARTNDPHSATSQFFINVVDNDPLNFREESNNGWGYTVYGSVVEGMNVVDKIRQLPTGAMGSFPANVPKNTVIIEKATLINK